MTVRIVTDSVADLPPQVAQELGITVVPLHVRFGTDVFRDGIELTAEQFYERLMHSQILPVTSVPSPRDYVDVYDKLAEETDEILVITVTARLSGTYEVALQSIGLMKKRCRVEVIDSGWAVMAQGFIVMTAARAAKAGASFDEVLSVARRNMSRVDMRAAFDTLEYLKRGGRIGKAQAFLGSMLHINPIIGMKDGEFFPFGRERSRTKALDNLYDFVLDFKNVDELAIEVADCPDDGEMLAERLRARFPDKPIHHSRTTPVIGTHTGPGLIVVSVLGDKT